MSHRCLKITLRHHEHKRLTICDAAAKPPFLADYSVIDTARNQNQLRRLVAILCRRFDDNYGPVLNDLHDLAVTWDNDFKEYRLWTYTRNWPCRASYYAGMIYAYRILRPKKKKTART